jgi:hypothetical protein
MKATSYLGINVWDCGNCHSSITMSLWLKTKTQFPLVGRLGLEDGVFHGETEQIAFDIYTGDAGTLASSMVKLELVVELQRSKAVEGFKNLLRRKLAEDGYIVVSDIDRVAEDWHRREAMGEADNLVYLDELPGGELPPEAA